MLVRKRGTETRLSSVAQGILTQRIMHYIRFVTSLEYHRAMHEGVGHKCMKTLVENADENGHARMHQLKHKTPMVCSPSVY